jgi:hypothetical protein
LPLRKAAKIVHTNALRIDWKTIVNPNELSFILGNPPFVGSKMMSEGQRKDLLDIFQNVTGSGTMDYVSAWFVKAATFIQSTTIKCAFVSTNSIAQGEQVGILWHEMFNRYHCKIHFAHQTFKWSNEAKGNASVYCVITGFANFDTDNKCIYEYSDVKGEPQLVTVKNINPYLASGNDSWVSKRNTPICNVPTIKFGNQPIDGGGFIIESEIEYNEILKSEPFLSKYIRKFVGSYEFINNVNRWVFWLQNIQPNELRSSKILAERLQKVKDFRLSSTRKETRDLAAFPTRFAFISHTENEYIIIPSVSSEKRKYIPIGFLPKEVITSNLCLIIPNANLYHLGILTSLMHMTWVKFVCGRLKSDYRYSNTIVYNNYPFPQNVTEAQKQKVTDCAHNVLEIRKLYPESSLADLYDALAMPPDLVKAHQALDKAVDLCYRPQPFGNELNRIEYLFWLYEQLNAPMFQVEKKKRK